VSRTKARLRDGLWPDAPASMKEPVELTNAARAQGLDAIAELDRLGVAATLEDGRARFRGRTAGLSPAARRIIECWGDVVEAVLINGDERL
jgi:hypothetical protein